MRADIGKLRRALGNPKPPGEVTREPYELRPDHLRRLARGDWRKSLPESSDLHEYVEDINSGDVIQADLFRYMLPVLLEMWRQDLTRENTDNGGTVEWLYSALARRRPVAKVLGGRAETAAAAFMRDAILDLIDGETILVHSGANASAYDWIGALASLGAIFPVVDSLWREWWSLETRGQAAALLQYTSELIYDYDNSLYPLWKAEIGGGPPSLWGPSGHIYEQSWLPENAGFLREVLTADTVEDGVRRAAGMLRGQGSDDLLDRLEQDFPGHRQCLERRVAALPEIFSRRLDLHIDWDSVDL